MKAGKVLFNVFWNIFVGFFVAVAEFLLGVACCITIIGIPLGLQHFKMMKIIFSPSGKVVVKRKSHGFMNFFWGIFGGWEVGFVYFLLACVLIITVIGAPIGLQLLKLSEILFSPFGREVINENQFSSTKNTDHDGQILIKSVCDNLDVVMDTPIGKTSIKEYFTYLTVKDLNFYDKCIKRLPMFIQMLTPMLFAIVLVGLELFILSKDSTSNENWLMILLLVLLILVVLATPAMILISSSGNNRKIIKYFSFLIPYVESQGVKYHWFTYKYNKKLYELGTQIILDKKTNPLAYNFDNVQLVEMNVTSTNNIEEAKVSKAKLEIVDPNDKDAYNKEIELYKVFKTLHIVSIIILVVSFLLGIFKSLIFKDLETVSIILDIFSFIGIGGTIAFSILRKQKTKVINRYKNLK